MLRQLLETTGGRRATLIALLAVGMAATFQSPEAATEGETTVDEQRPKVEILLDRLAHSPSSESAQRIERQILADWTESGSDTVDLLMEWSAEAMKAKDHDRALDYLNRVVTLAPDFPEGWNRRATVHYLTDDYANSLGDIARVLALQPRHFGALNGLGLVLHDLEQDGPALDAFRRAVEVHPFLEGVQKHIDQLTVEVEGRPI